MRALYQLIKSAIRPEQEYINRRKVDFIYFHHPGKYSRINKRTLEITVGFNLISQNLKRVSATIIDIQVDVPFTEAELLSFIDFIDNPSKLGFKHNSVLDLSRVVKY